MNKQIALLIFVAAIFLIFRGELDDLSLRLSKNNSVKNFRGSRDHASSLNVHLKSTEIKQGMAQSKIYSIHQSGKENLSQEFEKKELDIDKSMAGVALDPDRTISHIVKDVNLFNSRSYKLSPEELILEQEARNQWNEAYDKEIKKAYIEEFISRARRDGYRVIVNDEGEATQVNLVRDGSSGPPQVAE